jgi:hypothetical protein
MKLIAVHPPVEQLAHHFLIEAATLITVTMMMKILDILMVKNVLKANLPILSHLKLTNLKLSAKKIMGLRLKVIQVADLATHLHHLDLIPEAV